MSTRCQIGFYEKPGQNIHKPSALIYRHSDGDPAGILPDILPYCVRFDRNRGLSGIEYLAARLLVHLVNLHDGYNPWVPEEALGGFHCLGYGISDAIYRDLAYYYAIYGTGIIAAYAVGYDRENDRGIIFKKLGQILIGDIPDEQSAVDYARYFRRNSAGKRDG
jgi:hypothetical protein